MAVGYLSPAGIGIPFLVLSRRQVSGKLGNPYADLIFPVKMRDGLQA